MQAFYATLHWRRDNGRSTFRRGNPNSYQCNSHIIHTSYPFTPATGAS